MSITISSFLGWYGMFGVTPARSLTLCTCGFCGAQAQTLNPAYAPYLANFREPGPQTPGRLQGQYSHTLHWEVFISSLPPTTRYRCKQLSPLLRRGEPRDSSKFG